MRTDLWDGEVALYKRSRQDTITLLVLLVSLIGSLLWNFTRKTETGLTSQLETLWIDALRDPQRDVRLHATRSLSELNGRSPKALDALGTLLEDRDPSVRREAIIAVSRSGTAGKVFIPTLMRISKDDQDRDIRDLAGTATSTLRQAPNQSRLGIWLIMMGLATAVGVATFYWMRKNVKLDAIPQRKPVLGGM